MERANAVAVCGSAVLALALSGCVSRCPCETTGMPPAAGPAKVATATERVVLLEMAMLEFPATNAPRIPGAAASSSGGALSPAEAVALRRQIEKDPHGRILSMPKLLALPGQEASMFVGETYATEGEILATPRAGLEEPWSGWQIRAMATPKSDGRTVDLDVSLVVRDRLPEGSRVTASVLSTLVANEVRGSLRGVSIGDGGAAVLLVPPGASPSPGYVVLLVTPRVLDADAAASGR